MPENQEGNAAFLPAQTVLDLIATKATVAPAAPAILAPDRIDLDYQHLHRHIQECAEILAGLGISHVDRVGIAIPTGSELAVAVLAASAAGVAAPLNPSLSADEFRAYYRLFKVKSVIVPNGSPSDAEVVARDMGLGIITLTAEGEGTAGLFSLHGLPFGTGGRWTKPTPEDVALVLHTSGTTGEPKVVLETHRRVCEQSRLRASLLGLSGEDRCLNVMPIYYGHGLTTSLLTSLASGGSVVCPGAFLAPSFFEWMDATHPTWFSAAPTVHRSILARAAGHAGVISRSRLRIIRSSSASLTAAETDEIESTFGVPVINEYGMTETPTLASNPLPPGKRKPGSAGIAVGEALGVIDEEGRLRPAGQKGEVVARGIPVFHGYEGVDDDSLFVDGWFRTGDEGYLDDEGYLFITGRIKEIINRGGEKVSPLEIEAALQAHPCVAQALAFAMPDPRLGEEVAAAVVPKPGAAVTERELQLFASERLAPFKVPRRIALVDEMPKLPTGKLRRVGVAERLGLTVPPQKPSSERAPVVPPRTPLEETLSGLWATVLGHAKVGVLDQFLELGGDSILAAQLIARTNDALSTRLKLIDLFDSPTVEGMASKVIRQWAEKSDIDGLIAELDTLAPEEARRLLEEETRIATERPR